jgi:enhancing lycopene biosynthesis protein 2
MSKVAVVLAGCGVYDGAEINEAVLTLLCLEQQGASYECFAPNIEQMHVINHLTGEPAAGESRNVLVEGARIARGNIRDIKEAKVEDFDALIVPGGFGAAKNLSNFAVAGPAMEVQKDFLVLAQGFHKSGKPIGLVCIAPVMAAAICGEGTRCTIGDDAETAEAITAMGGEHLQCPVSEARVDVEHKLVTTPAYMLAGKVSEAYGGISACVKELLAMA